MRRPGSSRKARILALATVIGSFAPSGHAQERRAGVTWTNDPTTRCEFVSPTSLSAGPTHWVGACPGNKASGLGMLRRRDGDRAGAAFYGEMKNGVPVIGVIDNEGFRVGRFHDNDIGGETELDQQVRLDAFETAAKAARQISALYAKQGNKASAQHYESYAQQLDMQIE